MPKRRTLLFVTIVLAAGLALGMSVSKTIRNAMIQVVPVLDLRTVGPTESAAVVRHCDSPLSFSRRPAKTIRIDINNTWLQENILPTHSNDDTTWLRGALDTERWTGVCIAHEDPHGWFRALGLQRGDHIIAVNGRLLAKKARLAEVLILLSKTAPKPDYSGHYNISLIVARGDEGRELSYRVHESVLHRATRASGLDRMAITGRNSPTH